MNSVDWRNATPEQENLFRYAKSLIAFTTITPLFYSGLVAGSEFETYNAGKIYVALSLRLASTNNPSIPLLQFSSYDELNGLTYVAFNGQPFWDATAAAVKYVINDLIFGPYWFSRLGTTYTRLIFNGYRLTI